jgi:hypothetical protein
VTGPQPASVEALARALRDLCSLKCWVAQNWCRFEIVFRNPLNLVRDWANHFPRQWERKS